MPNAPKTHLQWRKEAGVGVPGPKRDRPHAKMYGRRWRKAREQYLRANPLCVECEAEGVLEPATVVDHTIPHNGDFTLFWDATARRAVCKRHHDTAAATHDGGFGHPIRSRGTDDAV